jgi:hypothetical protein
VSKYQKHIKVWKNFNIYFQSGKGLSSLIKNQKPSLTDKTGGVLGYILVEKHSPSMYKALGLIPRTIKQTNKKRSKNLKVKCWQEIAKIEPGTNHLCL